MGEPGGGYRLVAQMYSEKPSNLAPTTSNSCAGRISLAAAEGAQALVKRCRLRKDIPDPGEFWLAVAYVLNQYDAEIVRLVMDPFTGLPGHLKYPLEIADVKRACDVAMLKQGLDRSPVRSVRDVMAAEAAEKEAREAERFERYAERARAAPEWPPIAAKLRDKLRPPTFRSAFAGAKLGTFVDGNLEIIVPPGELETASAMRANILHWVRELFPSVAAVRFVEGSGEVAA
jgi:hypothetical protein